MYARPSAADAGYARAIGAGAIYGRSISGSRIVEGVNCAPTLVGGVGNRADAIPCAAVIHPQAIARIIAFPYICKVTVRAGQCRQRCGEQRARVERGVILLPRPAQADRQEALFDLL